jgi:DNA-binding MarR family transcriptional regulator
MLSAVLVGGGFNVWQLHQASRHELESRDPDVTRLLDRLERRGLVVRTRSARDRRVVEVKVADKGLELLRSLDNHVARFPRSLLGHLGPKKLEQLGVLLEHVIADLGSFP